ncbi:MAG: IS110 family transposase [Dongiaceae bacterium]
MDKTTAYATVATIGIDLGKKVFQVHGIDSCGKVVIRRAVKRRELVAFAAQLPPCLIGMEACASAHHWARELARLGHQVRLIPPAYVKAYVRRQKNDMADAAAICEAVTRPSMRFVPVKSAAQQGVLMLHRVRELLVGQRTALINALRGHLAEFGVVAPQGARHVAELVAVVADAGDARLPDIARGALASLVAQMQRIEVEIEALDRRLLAWHRADATSRRLATIPGIGPVTASAIVATVTDPSMFGSGREFAAFFGLVPRQSSSGGKERLGRISKMGDRYIRKLLVVGATAVLRYAKKGGSPSQAWAQALLQRKPFKVVAVALANKTARIAWAVLTRGGTYQAGKTGAAAIEAA